MKTTLVSFMLFAFIGIFASAQGNQKIGVKDVYKDNNITIHQLDDHTWIGTGNLCYNESLYIIEGNDKVLLIDAGTKIPGLKKIIQSIVNKPIIFAITHVHADHTGAAGEFDEMYLNPADKVMIPHDENVRNYKGKMKYLKDGERIDLGGRGIDVLFTPGHTPGSTTFIDKKMGYGFSGDSFGSGNLLLGTDFSTLNKTCKTTSAYLEKNKIKCMYPGHFGGDNVETIQRVKDLQSISGDVLSGKEKGKYNPQGSYGLDQLIDKHGVRINFTKAALK